MKPDSRSTIFASCTLDHLCRLVCARGFASCSARSRAQHFLRGDAYRSPAVTSPCTPRLGVAGFALEPISFRSSRGRRDLPPRRRVVPEARHALVDPVLQYPRGLEHHHPSRRNRRLFTGTRIAGHAWSLVMREDTAEGRYLDCLPGRQPLADWLDHFVDGPRRLTARR